MEPNSSILVVDDDSVSREALCELLDLEGYSTAQASNGQEALDYLHTRPPPIVILLDLMMPVMDGWRFMVEHGEDHELSKIPILIVSGVPAQSRVGPHRVVRKPIDAERLFALIAEYRRAAI